MGFDADTVKCGVCIANLQTGKVKAELIDYNSLVINKMPNFLSKINPQELLIRIEQPTLQTAIGVNKRKSSYNKNTGIYNSGQCAVIARLFQNYCLQKGLIAIPVSSQHRVRCDGQNLIKLSSNSIISKSILLKKQNRYLSKLDQIRAAKIFPQLDYLNDEIIDAALLILPDLVMSEQAINKI